MTRTHVEATEGKTVRSLQQERAAEVSLEPNFGADLAEGDFVVRATKHAAIPVTDSAGLKLEIAVIDVCYRVHNAAVT